MSRLFLMLLIGSFSLLVSFGAPPPAKAQLAKFGEAEFVCVSSKQRAAARYSRSALEAWAEWDKKQRDSKLQKRLRKAGEKLGKEFDNAEAASAKQGVDCVEQTATASDLGDSISAAAAEIAAAINTGLDLGERDDARCGEKLLKAAARRSRGFLRAESKHTKRVPSGGDASRRDRRQMRAASRFSRDWNREDCPTAASESDIASQLDALSDNVVFLTTVSPLLDDGAFQAVSPVGPIEYQGRTLNPRCGFDAAPDYHFFVKRGSVNKLVMYYEGGGACWENLTCGLPVCKNAASVVGDNPSNATTGFADLNNPDNPFKDWNAVFVTYCTCDLHFGDADRVYSGIFPDVSVSHRGYENAKVAEKFAREHFLNPDMVFVTGSSAGGYGALFHGPLLHEVWPASRFHVLGDASNGVITQSFRVDDFPTWNFEANIPDTIPGVLDSLTSEEGLVEYIEAVASFFDESTWAHYTTAYDGGLGGQTGFYNVMLNDNDPIAGLTWWEGSCRFNDAMVEQAADTFARVPDNYRFYIGTGSRHTMYGNDKVYTDQSGSESQTIVDWITDMIAFEPNSSSPSDWQNVECVDCEIVLPGDPRPNPLLPPFFDDMGQTVIVCEE